MMGSCGGATTACPYPYQPVPPGEAAAIELGNEYSASAALWSATAVFLMAVPGGDQLLAPAAGEQAAINGIKAARVYAYVKQYGAKSSLEGAEQRADSGPMRGIL